MSGISKITTLKHGTEVVSLSATEPVSSARLGSFDTDTGKEDANQRARGITISTAHVEYDAEASVGPRQHILLARQVGSPPPTGEPGDDLATVDGHQPGPESSPPEPADARDRYANHEIDHLLGDSTDTFVFLPASDAEGGGAAGYELEDVLITSYAVSGSSNSGADTEGPATSDAMLHGTSDTEPDSVVLTISDAESSSLF